MFVGTVPVATDHDDDQVLAMERKGLTVYDFQNTMFDTLEGSEPISFPHR